MRSLAPHDAIAFIESRDLAQTLGFLTKNKKSNSEPKDFSFLKNIQLAIIIEGFEATESSKTEENSGLDLMPRFVAVAETHAWNWQTISLVKNQMHNFIVEKFGADTEFRQFEKDSGRWFEWIAKDDRKAFAFVEGGRIYFSNNRDSIAKCLSVSNGDTESLKINESLNKAYSTQIENDAAFGYISPNGIAQIAGNMSILLAFNATESEVGRSFIISVLPKILQNTTREVIWTATETETGVQDEISVTINVDSSNISRSSFSTSAIFDSALLQFVPPDIFIITRYNLANPSEAWRDLLFAVAQNADSQYRKVFIQLSNNLLNSYAIADAEKFLATVDSNLLTAHLDAENEKSVLIVNFKDAEKIKESITDQINFRLPAKVFGKAKIWESEDRQISAAFTENHLILGDSESVYECLFAKSGGRNFTQNSFFKRFSESKATAVTFGVDTSSFENLSAILGIEKLDKDYTSRNYLTETFLTERSFERKTVSDFGFIGMILEKLK